MTRARSNTLFAVILAGAMSRLAPHPPNFTPIGAIALFGGSCFRNRLAAYIVPLAALAFSDLVLGLLVYGTRVFTMMAFVYVGFFFNTCLGTWIGRRRTPTRIGIAAVGAALVFFLTSNFGVWIMGSGGLYPHSLAGLVLCYTAALPFLLNMVLANLVFSAVLFAGFSFAERHIPTLREPSVSTATLQGPLQESKLDPR